MTDGDAIKSDVGQWHSDDMLGPPLHIRAHFHDGPETGALGPDPVDIEKHESFRPGGDVARARAAIHLAPREIEEGHSFTVTLQSRRVSAQPPRPIHALERPAVLIHGGERQPSGETRGEPCRTRHHPHGPPCISRRRHDA